MSEIKGAKPEKLLRLLALSGGHIREIRHLTESEGNVYRKAHQHLQDHDEAVSLIEMVRRNLKSYEECLKQSSETIPTRGGIGELSRSTKLEINRHFLNFLATARQFLDHTETRLKRQYSETPEVFQLFRKRTSRAFDNVFAYRFMYKLRNYSQHCGSPIGHVTHGGYSDENGDPVFTLHVNFDADALLRSGGDVWGVVKADLIKRGPKFSVGNLPNLFLHELEGIWEAVKKAERPHLLEHATLVLDTVSEVNPPYTTPAVARYWNHKGRSMTIEIINPPVLTMDWLGEHPFREVL
ncbi:MAG: hypothetical protein EOP12_01885 [Pseudomonas sp.]|nr:MAG: hypothetical protein EOP12_01885 [Pseudomonas sp.]